jgi:hypothetical protein
MKKAFLLIPPVLAALVLQACATGLPEIPGLSSGRYSDEQLIAAVLDDVHAGMESKRIYKVLAHVSQSYLDEQGRDHQQIREYLSEIMSRYRLIRITRARPKILVQGDRARALETFGTIAEPHNASETPSLHLQGHVSVFLERIEGKWKIVEWGGISQTW